MHTLEGDLHQVGLSGTEVALVSVILLALRHVRWCGEAGG